MRAIALLVGVIATATFLSGCVAKDASTTDESSAAQERSIKNLGHEHGAMMMDQGSFMVDLKDCNEAGGVSLYNSKEGDTGPVRGGPFKVTSTYDDTGRPLVASYFVPITSDATEGIWHISVTCESKTFLGQTTSGLEWGWVGVRIQPPPWDDSRIPRQYFIADLSFQDTEILDALKQLTNAHVSQTLDGRVDWVAPMVMHTTLDDENHGVFETHAKMKDWTPKVDYERIRFWMLVADHGGGHMHGGDSTGSAEQKETYHPISFDLISTPSDGYMVADGTAWLSHTRTDAHGAVPAATGNVGAIANLGFDRMIMLGPAPDLHFDSTWEH